ncbi:MAG TPA: hypothetical protein VKS22_06045 [Candidatus Binataceae bacterium]|nr:hypothetical protein [Candidatus Binataceae bacterium]
MLPLLLATRIAIASPSAAGHWAGTSKVRCGTRLSAQERCNAIQNITFDLTQDEAEVAGTYSCAYGTQNCLAMNRKGKITDGTFDGHSLMLSVDMGNGSTCRFKGGLKQKTGQGSYSCKGQSAAEQGTWKLHRVSAEAPAAPPKIPSLLRPNDPGSP